MLGCSNDVRCHQFNDISVTGTVCDCYMELLLSPIFGTILRKGSSSKEITEYVLNRWRWTCITEEVRQHFLDVEEEKANEKDRKAIAVAAKLQKKVDAALRTAEKHKFEASPEGQRIKRDKEQKAKMRLDHLGSSAKNAKSVQCSYCSLVYTHDTGGSFQRCSILSHINCAVVSCQVNQNCCFGYDQHQNIKTTGRGVVRQMTNAGAMVGDELGFETESENEDEGNGITSDLEVDDGSDGDLSDEPSTNTMRI
jgi:hypothetical protein